MYSSSSSEESDGKRNPETKGHKKGEDKKKTEKKKTRKYISNRVESKSPRKYISRKIRCILLKR